MDGDAIVGDLVGDRMTDVQDIADTALRRILDILGQAERTDPTLPYHVAASLIGQLSFSFDPDDVETWWQMALTTAKLHREATLTSMMVEASQSTIQ